MYTMKGKGRISPTVHKDVNFIIMMNQTWTSDIISVFVLYTIYLVVIF